MNLLYFIVLPMILAFVFVFTSHWHSRTLSTCSLFHDLIVTIVVTDFHSYPRWVLSPWAMYLSVSCPWGLIGWWHVDFPQFQERLGFIIFEGSSLLGIQFWRTPYFPLPICSPTTSSVSAPMIFRHWCPLYLGIQRKKDVISG